MKIIAPPGTGSRVEIEMSKATAIASARKISVSETRARLRLLVRRAKCRQHYAHSTYTWYITYHITDVPCYCAIQRLSHQHIHRSDHITAIVMTDGNVEASSSSDASPATHGDDNPFIAQSWTTFEEMLGFVQAYAEQRGFKVHHRNKATTMMPSSSLSPSSSSSPSAPSSLPAQQQLLPAAVQSSTSHQRVCDTQSTSLLHDADVLDTSISRAADDSAIGQSRNTIVPATYLLVHPPSSVDLASPSSGPLIPVLGHKAYTVVQVAPLQPAMPSVSFVPIRLRGWFVCEFAERGGDEKLDEEARVELKPMRNSLTPKAWKQLCPGNRKCEWRINYNYHKSTKSFHLIPKSLRHQGHAFRTPTSASAVSSFSDVTVTMLNKIRDWLLMRIPGAQIRTVNSLCNIHPFYALFMCVSHIVVA